MMTHNLIGILILSCFCWGAIIDDSLELEPVKIDGGSNSFDTGKETMDSVSKKHSLNLVEDTYDFSVLPPAVQDALSSLSEDTLLKILELSVTSSEIFGQVVLYLTLSWAETACEWIEGIAGLVEDGWEYFSSGEVVKDAQDVFEDVAETCNDAADTLCFWCDDMDIMPIELAKQLKYLTEMKINRKLAILKYIAWKVNGIVWDKKFVEKLGFETDEELMSSLIAGLKKLYKQTVASANDNNDNPLNDEIDLHCTLIDPVELINPHYVSTINILSQFLSAINYPDTAIAITFAAEVCVSNVYGGCIGGGIGFAVDGHGAGIIYETGYSTLTASTSTPDVDANFVVTLGIFSDISKVAGFALTAGVGANFPVFGVDISISTAERDYDWEPISVNFAAVFDLTGSEYDFSVGVSLNAAQTTVIAHLYSSECAIVAGTGGNKHWDDIVTNNYPKIGPSIDEHYHIYGGSTGTALITVSKDHPNIKETIEYKQGLIPSDHHNTHLFNSKYLMISALIIIGILFSSYIGATYYCFDEKVKDIEYNTFLPETKPLLTI